MTEKINIEYVQETGFRERMEKVSETYLKNTGDAADLRAMTVHAFFMLLIYAKTRKEIS